jgi:hypothetical protein
MNKTPSSAVNFFAVSGCYVVLALSLLEMHDRHLLLFGKLFHLGDEGFSDGVHQNARGELVAEMKTEEGGHSSGPLQCRHVNVEVHAIDAFYLQSDVLADNIGDTPWYAHLGSG